MKRIVLALLALAAGCTSLPTRPNCVYARQLRQIRRDTTEFFVMPAAAGTVVRIHGDTVDLWVLACGPANPWNAPYALPR